MNPVKATYVLAFAKKGAVRQVLSRVLRLARGPRMIGRLRTVGKIRRLRMPS